MKTITGILTAATLLVASLSASAAALHTATVDRSGKILSSSSAWIDAIRVVNVPNYPATYEIHFKAGTFDKAPGYCGVSAADVSDQDRLYHGHAKLGGIPTADKVSVLTQLIDVRGASGDSGLAFQVACSA